MRWTTRVVPTIALFAVLSGCGRRSGVEYPPTGTELEVYRFRETAGTTPPDEPTAFEDCGNDRRCRIARLRRSSDAQHRRAHAQARQQVRVLETQRAQLDARRVPRALHPWVVEALVTDQHFGASVGLHPHPHFLIGLSGAYFWGFSRDESELIPGEDGFPTFSYVGVNVDPAFVFGGELRWLMFEEPVTPYVGLGFHALRGSASSSSNESDGRFGSSNGGLDAHYLHAAIGLDVQFWWGLRLRAAMVLRPLIYVRVRDGADEVTDAEEGFRNGFRMFGAEGGLGWSL